MNTDENLCCGCFILTLVLGPSQLDWKYKANSGDKHGGCFAGNFPLVFVLFLCFGLKLYAIVTRFAIDCFRHKRTCKATRSYQ